MTLLNGKKSQKSALLYSNGLFTKEGRAADKTRESLAATAISLFQKAQSDRWKQEQQWYLNIAFFYGHHYVKFRNIPGTTNFDMYVPSVPYYRSRPIINHTRRVVRKEMSRLVKQQPNAFIIPSSSEDRDIFAAQAGEQIWSSLYRTKRINKVLRRAVFWQTVCGTGFLNQFWDWTIQDKISNTWGDIRIEPVTPFHLFIPDLREEELENQPYVINAQIKSKEWVRRTFNVEPTDHRFNIVDDSLLSVMGLNQLNAKRDTTIVLELWVKPGTIKELSQGGMYTVCNNQIVQGVEEWPYSHGEYPFSKLDAIPSGKFYSTSVVEDLIPLQRELNRTRGQIIENKNKMAKPQLVAEKGSVDASKITTEPGLVIEYKSGFNPPQPLPMQNLPSYVENEVNRIYSDISDLSGIHEVSQGNVPPGVTAATAIAYLEEQDESLVAYHYSSIEECLETTARQCLTYVKDYWDEPRIVQYVGSDRAFDVQTFKGSDLRGHTDIRIEAGSALPQSRAAKQAFIMDLMKMQFIDPQEGLELMEMGGLDKLYERLQVDIRQAQRENLKLKVVTEEDIAKHFEAWQQKNPEALRDSQTGLQLEPPLIVPVNVYDNHQIHIEYHNRFRKSQAYELVSDFTKALFEEHVKQHQDALLVGATATLPPDMANPLQPSGEQGVSGPLPEEQTEFIEGGPNESTTE